MQDLITKLLGQPLSDIKLIGRSHLDGGTLHHHPDFELVYLLVGDLFLELASVRQGESLRLSVTPAIQIAPDLDPGERPTITSIAPLVFHWYHAENRISEITLFNPRQQDDGVHCEAARLVIDELQVIFFDPTYTYGIRVGGAEQEGVWLDNRWQSHPPEAVIWKAQR